MRQYTRRQRRPYGHALSLPLALAVIALAFVAAYSLHLRNVIAASAAPATYYLQHTTDTGNVYAVATGLTYAQCRRAIIALPSGDYLQCAYDHAAALSLARDNG